MGDSAQKKVSLKEDEEHPKAEGGVRKHVTMRYDLDKLKKVREFDTW